MATAADPTLTAPSSHLTLRQGDIQPARAAILLDVDGRLLPSKTNDDYRCDARALVRPLVRRPLAQRSRSDFPIDHSTYGTR